MKIIFKIILLSCFLITEYHAYCQQKNPLSVTVPIILDHNRMLVDAEIQREDGSWRKVCLWIDSGSPNFFISEEVARDLGIDLSEAENSPNPVSNLNVPPPSGVRIGGMNLSFENVNAQVKFQPFWLFSTMHNDGNLPSTVLKKYHVVFDYPNLKLTIADPGSIKPQGISSPAHINPTTGIVQIDAVIDGDSLSFALDNGASYSFISEEKLEQISRSHNEWSRITGTLGHANMWGWWPANEETFSVVRIPQILWGQVQLTNIGIVGVPKFSPNGPTLGDWYSQKTERRVDGFLGTNALKAFRVEIDYANNLVYFEKGFELDSNEMDLIGISVRQLADSSYQVVGVVQKNGKALVEGVEPGDILISIDDVKTNGTTMGKVVDALRGKPGDIHILLLERNGEQFQVKTKVEHCL